MDSFVQKMTTLSQDICALFPHIKGKNPEYQPKDSHSYQYEHTPLSHSPWGSPNHWNKVPKVEMHKFDGSYPARWVSEMEHYFSLHDIQNDETKIHVGVLVLDQE
jgi:hypothetical protein